MDPDIREIKITLQALNDRLGVYIEHQEEVCRLHRKPIDEHIREGHIVRDAIPSMKTSLKYLWSILLLMLASLVSGAVWTITH